MNPNPEIWGAPDTWVNQNVMYTRPEADYPTIKAGKAKVASFRTLHQGNTENKTLYGESIDTTICPCGQDPDVSCFGKIAIFQKNASNPTIPLTVNEATNPINWCFVENSNGYPFQYNQIDFSLSTDRWAPNTGTLSTSNPNYNIIPFVFYQLKTLLLRIYVQTFNGYSDSYFGNKPINTQWRTLTDWKNNYSNLKICGISFDIATVYSADLNTIVYAEDTTNMSNNSYGTVAHLDSISNGSNEYYSYSMYGRTSRYRSFHPMELLSIARIPSRTKKVIFPTYQMFENSEFKATVNEDGQVESTWNLWQEVPYSEANYEKIMKMAACFGVPFTDTNKLSFKLDYTDTELCLPVIDENGVAHGEYTRGTANTTNDIYNADSVRDKNYDPSKPPTPIDPNTYSNITGFNTVTTNAALTKRYVLDAANVEKLADDLWTICSELSSTDFEHFEGKLKDEFLTQNPIDCIISLQRFPFQIPGLGTKAPIRLGKSEGTAQGYTTYFIFNTILFSGKQIFPRFGNCFLDYEPYTSYEIYVPFCGTRKLRAEDLIGHTVNVHMQIDLITGSCTAYIMADELVIETLNGSCAVDQQLSGAQTATMNANIFNGILAQKQTDTIEGMNIAKTWLPGNWVSDIMDPMGNAMRMSNAKYEAQKANYDITHVQVPPHKIGAASPLLGWYQEFDARIIIYYPEGDVINRAIPPALNAQALATFGHLKGFGTVSPGTVSQFRGDVSRSWYLQGDIIADGIPCTDSERKRIKSMFAAGVYI